MTEDQFGNEVVAGTIADIDMTCYAEIGQCEVCMQAVGVSELIFYPGGAYVIKLSAKFEDGRTTIWHQTIPKLQHVYCPD